MKILVVCQYYSPEPFRIADICEEFVRQGHEVLVVTGVPNYPEGKIYPEYKRRQKRDEIINGVRIHRCFTIGRRHNALFRFLNYYSYAFSSSRYASHLKEKFDLVFVNQLSPVIMAKAAIAYKKRHCVPMVLYCLDLWPESLTMGGISKDSFLYRYFHRISKKIYMRSERILVSSKLFSEYFEKEFGIKNTEYLPQYAETVFEPKKCYKAPNGTIDVMFAGNIGAMQSVETIVWAAYKTKDLPNLYWHVVGDGSELDSVKQLSCSLDLSNIIFYGRKALSDMPDMYANADAMIVTMKKNDIISMTLPGKIQTYMAAGKPILGAIDGEAAAIIKEAGCGMTCPAEDADGLANIVRFFTEHHGNQEYSERAFAFYQKMFLKDKIIQEMIKKLDF